MDPQVRAEFDEMRAVMREHERWAVAAHERAMKRMDRAEKRMESAEKRMGLAEKRMELAEKRADKFDQKLEATRKLVQAGVKLVTQLASETRELKRSQRAFLDSLRNGRNGHSHKS